jgi:hypothetical protein
MKTVNISNNSTIHSITIVSNMECQHDEMYGNKYLVKLIVCPEVSTAPLWWFSYGG